MSNLALRSPAVRASERKMTHRVLVVDDHPIVREGFKRLLDIPGLTVCGEAANGREAMDCVAVLKPDLVLMDLSMPEMGGIEATREIRRRWPATKVIVVSLHDSAQAAAQAKQAGAQAYVVKSRSATELIETVHAVLRCDSSRAAAQPASEADAARVRNQA
jgi:two-component system, NarL family, nitrate/nitrite response regulator NarL